MIAIVSDDGKSISFSHKGKELTLREGFRRLDEIYSNEPQEVKKRIDELKKRFYKAQLCYVFFVCTLRPVVYVQTQTEPICKNS